MKIKQHAVKKTALLVAGFFMITLADGTQKKVEDLTNYQIKQNISKHLNNGVKQYRM